MSKENKTWEMLHSDEGEVSAVVTERMKVPGGWLYHRSDVIYGGHVSTTMTFVSDPPDSVKKDVDRRNFLERCGATWGRKGHRCCKPVKHEGEHDSGSVVWHD